MKTNVPLIDIPTSHIHYMKTAKAKKHKADLPHFVPNKSSRLPPVNLLLSVPDETEKSVAGGHALNQKHYIVGGF